MTDEFPFEVGDTVLVRVRENGTSGTIVAKFEAECTDIGNTETMLKSQARFKMPWGTMNSVTVAPYEAEFEVVGDA